MELVWEPGLEPWLELVLELQWLELVWELGLELLWALLLGLV